MPGPARAPSGPAGFASVARDAPVAVPVPGRATSAMFLRDRAALLEPLEHRPGHAPHVAGAERDHDIAALGLGGDRLGRGLDVLGVAHVLRALLVRALHHRAAAHP